MAEETKDTLKLPSKQQTHEDAHVKRNVAATHADTDYANTVGRELSDEEFKRRMESGGLLIDSVMPPPPEISGYDTIWGTTMLDSGGQLRWQLANGYTYVTIDEVPHWRNPSPRTGTLDGVVGYNELVALKIKKGRKEMLAKRFHHDMPLATEASIRSQLSNLSDNAKSDVKIRMEEGMRNMGKAPAKAPTFNL
jgi:hypothetical protein